MSLPFPLSKSFFQKKNLEALALPSLVLLFLFGVLVTSIFVSDQDQRKNGGKEKDIGYYTDKMKVVSEGKTIEVRARVLQMSPLLLYQAQLSQQAIKVVTIIKKAEEQNRPHIRGTIFMLESDFSKPPSLDPNEMHVFVSKDGYDSAVQIEKFVGAIFPAEKNLNLEGGFRAWEKEGLPVEN